MKTLDKSGSLFAILAVVTAAFVSACGSRDPETPNSAASPPPRHSVSIGIQVSPAMMLVMAAQDEGLFAAEGVDVQIKEFTAGKFALQAFLSKGIDFAVSGEVPVALAALQGNPLRVVSQVVERTRNEVRVVALSDKTKATDAKQYFAASKRRLATSFGGGPEFFTYTFLKHHGIGRDKIEIISQKPEDMPAALLNGSVDAIAIFDPFAFIAEQRLADKGITFADEALYSELYVLCARPEQIEQNPEVIFALLRALVKASEFVAANPQRAKDIMQKYTKLDRTVIDGIWPNFAFRPALTAQLLEYWQAQAAWALETEKAVVGTVVPDFTKIIEPRFLQGAAPGAVQALNAGATASAE